MLAAVALLVGLVVLGTVVVRGLPGRDGEGTAADPASVGTATAAAPSSASEPGSGSSASPSAQPSSPSPTRTTRSPSPSPTPTPTPTPRSGQPTAAELEDAITGYYALVPDNTDQAWTRLTAGYQRAPSGGRQAYQRFWDEVDRVSVSGVEAAPPSRVEASVTYRRSGGRVATERTSFRLVREDGILKIAGSSVLSS